MMESIQHAALSDVGRVRKVNEDSLFAGAQIWSVSDGMGGHSAGDVASSMAIHAIKALDGYEGLIPSDIVDTITRVNQQITEYGKINPAAAGLGATITGVGKVEVGKVAYWAIFNVGDSRVYHVVGDRMARVTIDHSEVEEMVLAGMITEEEARVHPLRNVVTRSLGMEGTVPVDVWLLPVDPPERFLICSDGLHSELTDAQIGELVILDAEEAASRLVQAALAAGGHDNVSVIILDAIGDSVEDTQPRSDDVRVAGAVPVQN